MDGINMSVCVCVNNVMHVSMSGCAPRTEADHKRGCGPAAPTAAPPPAEGSRQISRHAQATLPTAQSRKHLHLFLVGHVLFVWRNKFDVSSPLLKGK